MTTTTETPSLEQRREQLEAQLTALQSQHLDIAKDVQAADADWRAALAAGEETGLLAERRRLREAELTDVAHSIQQVTTWLADVDAEYARRAPHEALDRDLERHVADIVEYEQLRSTLDGAHQRGVDAVEAAAQELTDVLASVRKRHGQLDTQTQNLRIRAGHLERTDLSIPGVQHWEPAIVNALRGTALWPLYLNSVQRSNAADLAGALGNTAARNLSIRR